MLVAGRILNRRYRVGRRIGAGGFAQVFLCDDLKLGRPVAVKVLDPEFAQRPELLHRFKREARHLASLRHPNVVPVEDADEDEGAFYLVMPFIDGGTLHDQLRGRSILPLPEAAAYLNQAAKGIDYIHRHKIVHRDIKPQNFLRNAEDDRLLLADFGIAKMLEQTAHSLSITAGTVAYMAPEQLDHQAVPATDIYALGCIFFQMLTGTAPYTGTVPQIIWGHAHEPIPAIGERSPTPLPAGTQAIVERALAKDPLARYPSAAALALAVEQLAGGARQATITVPGHPAPPLPPLPPVVRPGTDAQPTTVRSQTQQIRQGQQPGATRLRLSRRTLLGGAATVAASAVVGWQIVGERNNPATAQRPGTATVGGVSAPPVTPPPSARPASAAPAAAPAPTGSTLPTGTPPRSPRPSAVAPPTVAPLAGVGGYKGTLRYWALGYLPDGANQTGRTTDAALAAFSAANPGVRVQVAQADFDTLQQRVRDGAVDIFRLTGDLLPAYIQSGLVAPIDDYLSSADRDDIHANILAAISAGGSTYAWPLWVPPVGMYLNLDIFAERGVAPPQENWTYEQFVAIARRLTFTRADGTPVHGYSSLFAPELVSSWPFILGDGATPLDTANTRYTWNTPAGASGLQKLVDLARVHQVTPPDFGTQSSGEIVKAFRDDNTLAIVSDTSGSASDYRARGKNFAVRPMPSGALGQPRTAGAIGLIAVAPSPDRDTLRAAMALGNYLTGAQVSRDVPGYYLAPGARKSAIISDPTSLFIPYVAQAYITPVIAEWVAIRKLLDTSIKNAVLGKMTAAQALGAPAQEIDTLLAARR
ncbi:MAG TPA: serine/threonine-protein kinase [Thermomicrobiales bacterium]